jgi:hypothetical protein
MNTTSTPTPFIVRLTKNLHWAERAFLISLAIGTILTYSKINSSVLNASLIGLAITFFLYAYKPLDIIRNEDELLGFSDLPKSLISAYKSFLTIPVESQKFVLGSTLTSWKGFSSSQLTKKDGNSKTRNTDAFIIDHLIITSLSSDCFSRLISGT